MALFSRVFGKQPPADRTTAILERHLTRDFIVFPMAEQPSAASEVYTVAKSLGVSLPLEVVSHMSGRFPGIFVEAKEEIWPRPKELDVGPFWSFLYGLHTYTVSRQTKEWMRMEAVGQRFKQETGLCAVPVLRVVGDANVYCVGKVGEMLRFDHELGTLDAVEGSFFEVFEREVAALVERTARKKSCG